MATAGSPERRLLPDQLTVELVRHSVAEEQHLYPAVREHLTGGDASADKELDDHTRVEELLEDLQQRGADDDLNFEVLIGALKTEFTALVRDEEDNLGDEVRARPPASQRPGHPARQQAHRPRCRPGRSRP